MHRRIIHRIQPARWRLAALEAVIIRRKEGEEEERRILKRNRISASRKGGGRALKSYRVRLVRNIHMSICLR
jgi:hypothetical protein